MKTLLLTAILALLASPALAVPSCDKPIPGKDGMINYGFGPQLESDAAAQFEQMLNGEGIPAHQTRFWNGCLQTWVKIDGQDVMKFFDPDTLREVH
jgi:hypothetical protein